MRDEAPGALRFLLDEHVHGPAGRRLAARGVDVVFPGDVGLAGADDPELFTWARREGRIIVTRNYPDFAALVEEAARTERSFPGVLFLPASIPPEDEEAHVRALEEWIRAAEEMGGNPVSGTFAWLSLPGS